MGINIEGELFGQQGPQLAFSSFKHYHNTIGTNPPFFPLGCQRTISVYLEYRLVNERFRVKPMDSTVPASSLIPSAQHLPKLRKRKRRDERTPSCQLPRSSRSVASKIITWRTSSCAIARPPSALPPVAPGRSRNKRLWKKSSGNPTLYARNRNDPNRSNYRVKSQLTRKVSNNILRIEDRENEAGIGDIEAGRDQYRGRGRRNGKFSSEILRIEGNEHLKTKIIEAMMRFNVGRGQRRGKGA